jgi:hypothetical protein
MIPLQTTIPVGRFPKGTAAICLLLIFLDLISRFWPGERALFLQEVAWSPSHFWSPQLLSGVLFFPNLFSLLIQILFIWVFTPRLFERRGHFFALLAGGSGVLVALALFALIFPSSMVPLLLPEALIGTWLGAYMRRDIWGTVNTLVPGPGWIRVLEVPSYVQLFFWFFYQLIANLFLPEVLSNAPMPYAIGLAAFLWGFLFDSVWGIFIEDRNATA